MQFLKTNCKEGETRRGFIAAQQLSFQIYTIQKEDPFPTGNEPSDIFNSK